MFNTRLLITMLLHISIAGSANLTALLYEIMYDPTTHSLTIVPRSNVDLNTPDIVQTTNIRVTKYLKTGRIVYDVQTVDYRTGNVHETPLVQCSYVLKELTNKLEAYTVENFPKE